MKGHKAMASKSGLIRASAVIGVVAMCATAVAQTTMLEYQYAGNDWQGLFIEDFNGSAGPLPVGPTTNWASAGAGFNLDGAGNLRTPDEQHLTVNANNMYTLFSDAGVSEADEWVYETRFNVHVGTHPIGGGIWPGYRYYTLMHGTSAGIAFKGSVSGPYELQYRSSYSGETPIAVITTGLARDTWYTAAVHRKADQTVDFYLDGVLMLSGQTALSTAIPSALWFGSGTSAECAAVMDVDHTYIGTPYSTTGNLRIKKFFDTNQDAVFNGFDEYLAGWEYNVSNVAHGGTYDENLVTDENGVIDLTGLDLGDYTITETLKSDWTLTTGNSPVVVTLSGGTHIEKFGNVLPGDANMDGIVDGVDFTFLKANFGAGTEGDPATWRMANFNYYEDDWLVDGADFTILKAYFGKGEKFTGAPIPEPGCAVLLVVGALALCRRRTRR